MPSPPRTSRGKPDLVGRTLAGQYLIERLLGGGGMGLVYAARHTRLPTRFAIKVLHPDLGRSEEIYRRFRHEAEILSTLHHPNIVKVTDFNRLEDGTLYLVMEYLEGEDLQSRLRRRGPMPLHEVIPLFRQLGGALLTAHKLGVVHRDLKPQNLFLAREDRGDEVIEVLKVLDFGISKIRRPHEKDMALLAADVGQRADQTAIGRVLGTPPFMAPEQARGQNQSIDGRADQFAMAAILYYVLSGELPFRGATSTAILYQVLFETPPPIHELTPVPSEVSAVLDRALSKDPSERYPSVADLIRALEEAGQRTLIAPQEPAQTDGERTSLVSLPSQNTPTATPTPTRSATPQPRLDSGPAGLRSPQTDPQPPAADQTRRTDLPGGRTLTQIPGFATTLSGGSGTLNRRTGLRTLPRRHLLLAPAALLVLALPLLVLRRDPGAPAGSGPQAQATAPADPPPAQPARPAAAARPTASAPSAAAAPTTPPPQDLPSQQDSQSSQSRQDLEGLIEKGEERLRAADLPEARRLFEQALRLDPQNGAALTGLGAVEMEDHDYSAALRPLRDAVTHAPTSARAHLLLCQARFRLGERSAARTACSRALQLDPQSTGAKFMLRALK